MKQVAALPVPRIRKNQMLAAFLQSGGSLLVSLLYRHDFLGRETLGKDLAVTPDIAIKTKMKKGVKAKKILGILSAKNGHCLKIVNVRTQGHGFQAHSNIVFRQKVQTSAKGHKGARLPGDPFVGLLI